MKKILILSAFIFCFSFAKAQGNLQFNQVIMYDMAGSAAQAITIPAGKVWKIESVGNSGVTNPAIYLRNAAAQPFCFLGYATSTYAAQLPFWLPSGFTGSFLNGNASRGCVSIIEFNVVP